MIVQEAAGAARFHTCYLVPAYNISFVLSCPLVRLERYLLNDSFLSSWRAVDLPVSLIIIELQGATNICFVLRLEIERMRQEGGGVSWELHAKLLAFVVLLCEVVSYRRYGR